MNVEPKIDSLDNEKDIQLVQKEQEVDLITSDLFYEILADIISDPVPQR